MGADPQRFSERLGHHPVEPDKEYIWFHAASLGEVGQIGALAQTLRQDHSIEILVTTTTATGADWVAKNMAYATHRFAPIETPAAVRRFLDGVSIKAAIFVESDLSPRLLKGLEKREVPCILLNARHSKTRARLPKTFSALLRPFALITCRSEAVSTTFLEIGVSRELVHILPDLRLSAPKLSVLQQSVDDLRAALKERPVWLAASTHPADESAVLSAHQEVLKQRPDALLIVAPRHPERAGPIKEAAVERSLSAVCRSELGAITENVNVYIADTLGELGVFYTLSPIAFLGGSFGDEGGHNPYEPAHFETALVSGPRVKNFASGYDAMRAAGACEIVDQPDDLGPTIAGLLQGHQAQIMGKNGVAFVQGGDTCASDYKRVIERSLGW